MATRQGSSAVRVTPEQVGQQFVRIYYDVVSIKPQDLYRFYKEESQFTHQVAEEVVIASGQDEINRYVSKLPYHNSNIRIDNVHCQACLEGAVLVVVSGKITLQAKSTMEFNQTFLLYPQEFGYFVRNDVFQCHAKENQKYSTVMTMPVKMDSAISDTSAIETVAVVATENKKVETTMYTSSSPKEDLSAASPVVMPDTVNTTMATAPNVASEDASAVTNYGRKASEVSSSSCSNTESQEETKPTLEETFNMEQTTPEAFATNVASKDETEIITSGAVGVEDLSGDRKRDSGQGKEKPTSALRGPAGQQPKEAAALTTETSEGVKETATTSDLPQSGTPAAPKKMTWASIVGVQKQSAAEAPAANVSSKPAAAGKPVPEGKRTGGSMSDDSVAQANATNAKANASDSKQTKKIAPGLFISKLPSSLVKLPGEEFEKTFRSEFSKYGQVKGCEYRHGKTYVFVEMDSAESVQAAITAWSQGPPSSGPFEGKTEIQVKERKYIGGAGMGGNLSGGTKKGNSANASGGEYGSKVSGGPGGASNGGVGGSGVNSGVAAAKQSGKRTPRSNRTTKPGSGKKDKPAGSENI